MASRYTFINEHFNEFFYLSSGGFEHCDPLHTYGPAERTGYMIHYVSAGKGTFTSGNNQYAIMPGEFFFIQPGKVIKMKADRQDPWTINWIRFKGKLVDEYMNETSIGLMNPVFTVKDAGEIKEIIFDLIQNSENKQLDDLFYSEKLLEIIRIMRHIYPLKSLYNYSADAKIFHKGIQFIQNSFDSPINVEDIAKDLSVDRSYLYRAFKKWLNTSPKEYLTSFRMSKAKEILRDKNNKNPINIIAFSCGFEDAQHFARVFKEITGMTPTQYRNNKMGINKLLDLH